MPKRIDVFTDGMHVDGHCFPWYLVDDGNYGVEIVDSLIGGFVVVRVKMVADQAYVHRGVSIGGCCQKVTKEVERFGKK